MDKDCTVTVFSDKNININNTPYKLYYQNLYHYQPCGENNDNGPSLPEGYKETLFLENIFHRLPRKSKSSKCLCFFTAFN